MAYSVHRVDNLAKRTYCGETWDYYVDAMIILIRNTICITFPA